MSHTVDMIAVPRQTMAVERFHITLAGMDSMGPMISGAFESVAANLARAGSSPAGPPAASYAPTIDGFDVAAGFPVDPSFNAGNGIDSIEVGGREVAHTMHLGSYESLPEAYEAIEFAAMERGASLATDEPMWEVYLTNPGVAPDQMRTEIFWPLGRD